MPEAGSDHGDVLAAMLAPQSVVLIGASRRTDSLGGRLLPILRQHGYAGRVYLVNPSGEPILGEPTYRSVADLPSPAETAVVVVAADRVAAVLDECGRHGIRRAIVLSSGFDERRDELGATRQRELEAVRVRHGLRLLGPNCEGVLSVAERTPLTFSPAVDLERALRQVPEPGAVAVVSQSGGLGFALFHDGAERGLRFSYVVSTGNECDVDVLDVLELLLSGGATSVVLCFVEGVRDLDRFADLVGRASSRQMTVVCAKVGRSPAGARGALAHTAHEAGDSERFEEALRSSGGIVARDQEELVDLGLAFERAPRWSSGGVAVLSISGGAGVWAADACVAEGLEVPLLGADVQERLRPLMPAYGSALNPVDVTAAALSTGGLVAPLEIILGLGEVGAVLVVGSFGGPAQLRLEGDDLGRIVRASGKPVVVYSYTRPGRESIELFGAAGLAWYPSPGRAARVLAALRC
ncbi:MAG TPA: CoA-binding protein [Acidimicrobiales bacterium]|nr:CoA-binding protein [Acidimicrobiales bacterium]